ncbi:hypothetical protein M501DRAFT_1002495 [Patellaria atrata CBS 101060]|uniref:Uncharacterized protein n=1 Tax=Patellaria atrata CBS 101060 TaxID=1346257 RepID=A0A9P4VST2_9PEZI|nr:hypothetical protein M501DRAFT_1002495 [Patellaria atrata CBS 101060]
MMVFLWDSSHRYLSKDRLEMCASLAFLVVLVMQGSGIRSTLCIQETQNIHVYTDLSIPNPLDLAGDRRPIV